MPPRYQPLFWLSTERGAEYDVPARTAGIAKYISAQAESRLDLGEPIVMAWDPGLTSGFSGVSIERGDVLMCGVVVAPRLVVVPAVKTRRVKFGEVRSLDTLRLSSLFSALLGAYASHLVAVAVEDFVVTPQVEKQVIRAVETLRTCISRSSAPLHISSRSLKTAFLPFADRQVLAWHSDVRQHILDATAHALALRNKLIYSATESK